MEEKLLLRFLRCETTHEEETLLADWLEADTEHLEELNRLQLMMEGMALCAPELEEMNEKNAPARVSLLTRFAWVAVAASIIMIIGAGLGYNYFTNQLEDLSNQKTIVEVPAGQRICMTLSDGTEVWLNAGAKMEYPSVFSGKQRKVRIDGEAMFNVTHDAKHPFVVETYACNIEVLGTRFNVEADASIDLFTAALMSGSIKLTSHANPDSPIIMKVNEEVELLNGGLHLKEIENFDEYLWPEGIISVSGVEFQDLMTKFERIFNVKIEIRHKGAPIINRSRGKIRVSDGVSHALKVLQSACDFNYQKDPETGIITIM